MVLAIATNNAALQAAAAASSVNRDMETSMARLSTGRRINSASDDAAGVAIASRLSAEIRGTDQAIRNALDGQAVIDTAEGAHKEVENILQRMREVSVQAANDTNSTDDRSSLKKEMDAMVLEIDRIASVTTWAGKSMLKSDNTQISLQVGAATGTKNQITLTINSISTAGLGISGTTLSVSDLAAGTGTLVNGTFTTGTGVFDMAPAAATKAKMIFNLDLDGSGSGGDTNFIFESDTAANWTTSTTAPNQATLGAEIAAKINADAKLIAAGVSATVSATVSGNGAGDVTLAFAAYAPSFENAEHALASIDKIDTAIKEVNTQRSSLGAVSNRLGHTVANLTNISSNLSAAKGGIEDADFALETTQLAKNQILQQASTAMLAQANASKQNVLTLLQG
jgi:flagellin